MSRASGFGKTTLQKAARKWTCFPFEQMINEDHVCSVPGKRMQWTLGEGDPESAALSSITDVSYIRLPHDWTSHKH